MKNFQRLLIVLILLIFTACNAADAAAPVEAEKVTVPVVTMPQPTDAPTEVAAAPTLAPTATPEPTATPSPPTPTPTSLPDPSPVLVQPEPDHSRAASQAVGPEGGNLEVSAADGSQFRLTLPAGSLLVTETITMTPLIAIDDLPFSGGLAAGVQLEPDGLWLIQPASLVITPSRNLPLADQTFFAYLGSGDDFHLYPPELSEAITLRLNHFSGYGVGQGTDDERSAQLHHLPDDPLARLSQEAAELFRIERELQLQGKPGDPKFWDKYHALIRQAFEQVVKPTVEAAKEADNLPQIQAAIQLLLTWSREAALAGDEEFIIEQTYVNEAFEALIAHAVEISALECKEKHDFDQLTVLIGLERMIQIHGWGDHMSALQEIIDCLRFELRFHSVISEGGFGDAYGYRYELQSTVILDTGENLFEGKLIGAAPLEYVSVSWIGSDGCGFNAGGEGQILNVKDGLNKVDWPFAPGSNEVVLTYDPGTPAENVTMSCPGADPLSWHTNAWKEYFDELHAWERVEGSYQARTPRLSGEVLAEWTYYQSTFGPSGQQVIEETLIELVHRPLP